MGAKMAPGVLLANEWLHQSWETKDGNLTKNGR